MITNIVIEQFGPFRDRVELPLADQGFVLIKGRNLVSAAADANGVGKTSIANAIAWGLFGEDLAGRKADAVACRFTTGQCSVRLDLEDALGKWSILRTRRPARLMVEGIPGIAENEDMKLTQEKIEQRLGIGVRTFKNAVVFGQGAFDRFAQANQEEQMKMLDEIQGIDFREPLARAKEWQKDLKEKLDSATNERDKASMTATELSRSEGTLLELRNTFSQTKAQQVEAAQKHVAICAANVHEALMRINEADKQVELLAKIKAETAKAGVIKVTLDRRATVLSEAHIAARGAKGRYDDLVKRLDALLEQGDCPTCRQPIKARKAKIRELFALELNEKSAEAQVAEQRAEAFQTEHTAEAERYTDQLAKIVALIPEDQQATGDKYIAGLEFTCSDSARVKRKAALQTLMQDHNASQEMLVAAEALEWTGADSLARTQQHHIEAVSKLAAAEQRIPKLQTAIIMADYAVEAFGDRGIRSLLVDGVADYLNQRAAKHLEVLAAGEATQTMAAQTALKKGGAKERISFKREWSWGGTGEDDGSGGQNRRMDLATFAAVQDLSEHRSARPFPIKIWDEPGDALDARGQELFLQWVAQQARTRGTGLLITHSEGIAAAADPDHVWTVVLGPDGARVEIA